MYWLQRPPYLRWAAATLLVVGALIWDLRPAPTGAHPFSSREIAAGEQITADAVEWRTVPAGLLTAPALDDAVAAVDVPGGEPLTGPLLAGLITVPDGWVTLPIDIGGHAGAGDRVVLIVTDPPLTVPGIVVDAQSGDRYSLHFSPAVVAVPGDRAVDVAVAATRGQVVAAVAP